MISLILVIYLILIFGACLQSVAGFGLGLLGAPLVFFLNPELVPGPMILLALLNTAILSAKYRTNIDTKQTRFALVGGTIGVVLAALILKQLNVEQYQYAFGALILLSVLLSVVGFFPRVTKSTSLVASFVSGVMGTITAAGGTPMGLLYQSEAKEIIRANLSIFFLYINLLAILALLFTGVAGYKDFTLFLMYSPAIFVGIFIAKFVNPFINKDAMRILVLVVATVSGLILIM